jgi:hypothetical protein
LLRLFMARMDRLRNWMVLRRLRQFTAPCWDHRVNPWPGFRGARFSSMMSLPSRMVWAPARTLLALSGRLPSQRMAAAWRWMWKVSCISTMCLMAARLLSFPWMHRSVHWPFHRPAIFWPPTSATDSRPGTRRPWSPWYHCPLAVEIRFGWVSPPTARCCSLLAQRERAALVALRIIFRSKVDCTRQSAIHFFFVFLRRLLIPISLHTTAWPLLPLVANPAKDQHPPAAVDVIRQSLP